MGHVIVAVGAEVEHALEMSEGFGEVMTRWVKQHARGRGAREQKMISLLVVTVSRDDPLL